MQPPINIVQNRLDPQSQEDGMIRGIEIVNNNGEKAILTVFSAHATNIPSRSRSISGDYPGQLNRCLEKGGMILQCIWRELLEATVWTV
jgi:hypothetical protein